MGSVQLPCPVAEPNGMRRQVVSLQVFISARDVGGMYVAHCVRIGRSGFADESCQSFLVGERETLVADKVIDRVEYTA